MGVVKFKRPLLVEGTEVPPEGGFEGGAVDSVNGQTGTVVLDASDVGVDFATISAIEGDWRGEGVETLGAALLALQGA